MKLEQSLTFENAVLYAVLHEPCYSQGDASNWAAERVGKTFKEFQWLNKSPQNAAVVREHPLYFSGEMIYPFLFDNFPELEKLKPVADILAEFSGWPDLYDEWQLARNEVPVYSATFVDDMVSTCAMALLRYFHILKRILNLMILNSTWISAWRRTRRRWSRI
jgi:hypothetical protein